MLAEALPELIERTDVEEVYTDGGYGSPTVDELMRGRRIRQFQTAFRGRKPSQEKLGLSDFDWGIGSDGKPQTIACPHGQWVAITPGRKKHRFRAAFEAADCKSCPFAERCPAKRVKSKPERVLWFSQREVDVALRRQQSGQARASGGNLRAAVEATVWSVKHPFGNGKVPVRGQPRVSMVMIGSTLMSNLRRIHRYLRDRNGPNEGETGARRQVSAALQEAYLSFWPRLQSALRSIFPSPIALARQL